MAGEVYEDDDSKKLKKSDFMCNKPWYQRLIILVAGVVNNFILAIILLFVCSLLWGQTAVTPKVASVVQDSPMAKAGIVAGDTITKINNHKVSTWDVAQIYLYMKDSDNVYDFEVLHENGEIDTYSVTPEKTKNEKDEDVILFGVNIEQNQSKNFFSSIKYAFVKFQSIVNSMVLTVYALITGKISINALSGPVGIFQVVGASLSQGIYYLVYITALLSINVGVINILPFPAFDGGRVLFLIIEKIKGSPVNSKIENLCHTIGFILLIILMIYITIHDIIRIF